ncbi:MAG: TraR/DksA family transcriptional regulator [Acidimicrobiales bacterium]
MDEERARALLAAERLRVELLLRESRSDARDDREAENESGVDIADPAERLTAEGLDDSVVASLQSRLEAIERAEVRLITGTYGRSVESGDPIPDARLEADPAAELTVSEASRRA